MTNMIAQTLDRSKPSHKPRSPAEIEMENRLMVAHAREAMSSAQNRVPSGADRASSLDIRRHYHRPELNPINQSYLLISSIKVEVKKKHFSFGWNFSCFAAHLIERELF